MFERFTDRARKTCVLARVEAQALGHNFIAPEHLLLGLAGAEGVAAQALEHCGLTLEGMRLYMGPRISPPDPAEVSQTDASSARRYSMPFTLMSKKVLELALREALQLGHNYIGTEHILLAVIRAEKDIGYIVSPEVGQVLRQTVIHLLAGFEPSGQGYQPVRGRPAAGTLEQTLVADAIVDPLAQAIALKLMWVEEFGVWRLEQLRKIAELTAEVARGHFEANGDENEGGVRDQPGGVQDPG